MVFTWAVFFQVAGLSRGSMSFESETIGWVAIHRRHRAISPVSGLTMNGVHYNVDDVARN